MGEAAKLLDDFVVAAGEVEATGEELSFGGWGGGGGGGESLIEAD